MDCVFKPGQTYKTRDGREAFVGYERDGWLFGDIDSVAYRWRASGGQWAGCADGGSSLADLMPPAPPRIREKVWANMYSYGARTYRSQQETQEMAAPDSLRIAVPCMLVEIVDGEPGE